MSSVELPQVPSARSSSASSSGRRNLSSAGSDMSLKSQQSNPRRSYREFESENDEDDDQNGQDDDVDDDDHEHSHEQEEPQETGSGLWDEVETFLSKPSPSLATLAKGDKAKTSANRLPTIKSDPLKRENQAPSMRPTRPVRSVYAASSSGAAGSKSTKAIDPKLLQEAFAYAQRVQSMDYDDDQQEEVAARSQFARHASSSSNSSSSSLTTGVRANSSKKILTGTGRTSSDEPRKKSSSKPPSAYSSSVKPQRKKSEKRVKEPATQWDASNSSSRMGDASHGSSSSGCSTSEAPSRKTMDPQTVQSLVSNFQNGTTLEELRRELAASQQSMHMSRQIIQEAAQSFFQPAR